LGSGESIHTDRSSFAITADCLYNFLVPHCPGILPTVTLQFADPGDQCAVSLGSPRS
jgi:hypothetical protein